MLLLLFLPACPSQWAFSKFQHLRPILGHGELKIQNIPAAGIRQAGHKPFIFMVTISQLPWSVWPDMATPALYYLHTCTAAFQRKTEGSTLSSKSHLSLLSPPCSLQAFNLTARCDAHWLSLIQHWNDLICLVYCSCYFSSSMSLWHYSFWRFCLESTSIITHSEGFVWNPPVWACDITHSDGFVWNPPVWACDVTHFDGFAWNPPIIHSVSKL